MFFGASPSCLWFATFRFTCRQKMAVLSAGQFPGETSNTENIDGKQRNQGQSERDTGHRRQR